MSNQARVRSKGESSGVRSSPVVDWSSTRVWTGVARCRACSTAERTATNIVIAPIACAHRAAPCSSCLRSSAPRAPCSSCSLLFAPAPHACAPRSSLALPALPAPCTRAPFTHSSLLGFGAALGHFRAPRVRTIPYLGFASQHLA